MAVEMSEKVLEAGIAALKAVNEKCAGIGAKLQKDFRGDAAFPCEDPVGQFAKEAEAASNTMIAMAKAAESSAVEIEQLRKDKAELIELVKQVAGERDMLLKGHKPCSKCLSKGAVNGVQCDSCKGARFVKSRVAA